MEFSGKLAVITGAGSGIGRALAQQLTQVGCHVAICDVSAERLEETRMLCVNTADPGVRISTHVCDVADESSVLAFRDAVLGQHKTKSINLLFNNAGIGGGGSFLKDPREEWERVFAVDFWGVYYCSRAFIDSLIASEESYLVNVSSINGFFASIGGSLPDSAYSTANFAVKGFTEALVVELRLHAPHVKPLLVMPGHIGTHIVLNSLLEIKKNEGVQGLRDYLVRSGVQAQDLTEEEIDQLLEKNAKEYRKSAPTSAQDAAFIMLDGIKAGKWRILVGDDAYFLDEAVRADPENAYESSFFDMLAANGHFRGRLK